MVGQEILVLFIMVRIRALQPIFKRTLVVRFNIGFGSVFGIRPHNEVVWFGTQRSEVKGAHE